MDEIPEGLDDLLKDILGEDSKSSGGSSSLAIIPKKKKKKTKTESVDVDERILRILDLEDVSDIDYDTYKTLLREKMAASRMSGDTGFSTEETEILTNEYKRVKNKTGRFKPKEKKVSKEKFFSESALKVSKTKREKQRRTRVAQDKLRKIQDSAEENLKEESQEESQAEKFIKTVIAPSLEKIEKNLSAILETLTKQFEIEKKQSEKEKIVSENIKRSEREKTLEKQSQSNIGSTIKRVTKPVQGIFDSILNFFKNVLLGSAVMMVIDLINNPAKVLQPIIDFTNGIIDFVNNLLAKAINVIFSPFNYVVSQLWKGLDQIENAINTVLQFLGQQPLNNIDPNNPPTIKVDPKTFKPIPNITNPFGQPVQGMEGGGLVSSMTGSRISGMGKDTQLVALSPGEIVMSNKAGDMYGRDNLLAANAAAGGTNKPKRGKILGYEGGGMVGGYGINRVNRGSLGTPTMGLASKGIILVPGHYGYGGGTPGATRGGLSRKHGMAVGWDEYIANKMIAQSVVEQVKALNPGINIQFYEKPGGFSNSNQGLRDAISHYKELEGKGYEVIEIHHDAYGSQGAGAGLLGSYTNYSALDRRLAEIGGSFGFGYKGRFTEGYGMNRAGISMFEVAKLEGDYEQSLIAGDQGAIKAGSAPLVKAISEVYGSQVASPRIPSPPSGGSTEVIVAPAPVSTGSQSNSNSASVANQKKLPVISAIDSNNTEMIVVKSIYNIVG